MKISLIKKRVKKRELNQMRRAFGSYIKLAVDIRREILAGGGILHQDCQAALLKDGSKAEDIWGVDLLPATGKISFVALLNIKAQQDNPSMKIKNLMIRRKIEKIVRGLLG